MLLSLVVITAFSNLPLNDGTAHALLCAKKLLEGRIPYVDFIDSNPPMTFYIHTVPWILAHFTGFDVVAVWHVLVVVLAGFGAFSIYYSLAIIDRTAAIPYHSLLVASWLSYMVYAASFGVFGDKEHLFVTAYIPFFYCRLARHCGSDINIAFSTICGLICGPFALLKPHFCLTLALAEGWMLMRSKKWSSLLSPESIGIGAWSLSYVIHFLVIPQEMQRAFFLRWLPFVMENYTAFDAPITSFAFRGLTLIPFFVPLGLLTSFGALAIARRFPWARRLQMEGLAICFLTSYAMFIVQHKGWTYHLYAALGFFALLIGTLSVAILEKVDHSFFNAARGCLNGKRGTILAIWLVMTLFCVGLASHRYLNRDTVRFRTDPLVGLFESLTRPNDSVILLAERPQQELSSVVYANRSIGSRYLTCQFLSMLIQRKHFSAKDASCRKNLGHEGRRILDELGSDILEHRPRLVCISAAPVPAWSSLGCGTSVAELLDHVGWMGGFMGQYQYLFVLRDFRVYKLRKL